ncbi:MAG: hypothetical protein R2829_10000 [Bacteroidia bacterium]
MSPSATTWYVATAIDNSAGPNSGCAVKDSVEIFTGASLAAGTVTASCGILCIRHATLSVTGADGGIIQWQESTVSASGPWTNVGTPSTVYAPGTITQTTWYQVKVSCQSSEVFSNVRESSSKQSSDYKFNTGFKMWCRYVNTWCYCCPYCHQLV